MVNKKACIWAVMAVLCAGAGSLTAADDLWLHVRVDEAGGAKVTVNLPLALIEKAMPLVPREHIRHLDFDHHAIDGDIEDLREMWSAVRDSPDMTFVTVDDSDERVRVWKEAGNVFVEVRGRHGDEEVDVRVPIEVVDAFLAGEEFDFRAAVRAMVEHGTGEFVEVRDDEDHVRVWVDRQAEAGE